MTAQPDLFGDSPPPAASGPRVGAAVIDDGLRRCAAQLDTRIRLGTSSWHFPGWAGSVYDRIHRPEVLSRHGLRAYAQHPLLRTVSLDRSFYRPLAETEFAALADQVQADFRFIVKAWSGVTDAVLRDGRHGGPPFLANPGFLDAASATERVVEPAANGLGSRLGALVFQLSPLPSHMLDDGARWLDRLSAFLRGVQRPSHGVIAVELRDAALLTPALAAVLKAEGVGFCLGLHDRMPALDDQLPMLRALWPAPLVCRWSLQRGLRYEQARGSFAPFDRLASPDTSTRRALARVALATARAGQDVLIALNNKAEGSAPRSVAALAEEIVAQSLGAAA